ncbi:MAG: alpha/beta fold hydrolase [Saprospiraceae bacterium]
MTAPAILFLHGALASRAQFSDLTPLLGERFDIHTLNFAGHGSFVSEEPFSMELFIENVLHYLEKRQLENVNIFGYSMGGYVACLLAKEHPERVSKVVTLGTKFHWDIETAVNETAMLIPENIEQKVPRFAQTLMDRHGSYWQSVVQRTRELLWSLGEQGGFKLDDAAKIRQPIRLMLGDRDKTVTMEETLAIFQALPHGELEVLPNTGHPFEKASPTRLAQTLHDFFI